MVYIIQIKQHELFLKFWLPKSTHIYQNINMWQRKASIIKEKLLDAT